MQRHPLVKQKEAIDIAVSDSTRRPLIGIVGHMIGPNSFGITFPYLRYFEGFGNVKIIVPTSKEIDTNLDLLVIPGGPDVDTSRYLGERDAPSWFTQKPDPMREYFDINLLPKYVENRTPIFGICRGHQSIAVLFGAKLEQHLWIHEENEENKRKEEVHRCIGFLTELDEENKSMSINAGSMAINFGTNSMHHQAVKTIPEGAYLLIWTDELAPKNKTVYSFRPKERGMRIEGLIYKDYPIITVQYHPKTLGLFNVN